MSVRMGICSHDPWDYDVSECSMSYDSGFVFSLQHVKTGCIECGNKSEETKFRCQGCYGEDEGYFVLPKQVLIDLPYYPKNYDAMMELFDEDKVEVIYIILF